jgi:hypothetical protein
MTRRESAEAQRWCRCRVVFDKETRRKPLVVAAGGYGERKLMARRNAGWGLAEILDTMPNNGDFGMRVSAELGCPVLLA